MRVLIRFNFISTLIAIFIQLPNQHLISISYSSGVYDDSSCPSNTVNHAMLIVGYTKDAWILKNWWGSHWGQNGYMLLKRNKNRCGIANYAAYALV